MHIILAGGGGIYLLLVLLPLAVMYTGLIALVSSNDLFQSIFEFLVEVYLIVLCLISYQLLHSLFSISHAKDCRGVIEGVKTIRKN